MIYPLETFTKCKISSVDEFGTTGNCDWFECLGKNILGAMWQLKTILGRKKKNFPFCLRVLPQNIINIFDNIIFCRKVAKTIPHNVITILP